MPGIYLTKDEYKDILYTLQYIEGHLSLISQVINSATRVKNIPGSNQPLAPRKPAGSRAKGNTPKGDKPKGKGAGKK